MNENSRLSPLEAEMVAGLSEFADVLDSGEAIQARFTVRTVTLDLRPTEYGPEEVRRVRGMLGASQTLLANFLGVSVKTLRSWEQGARPVPTIARRYLDDIVRYPEIWNERIRAAWNSGGQATPRG